MVDIVNGRALIQRDIGRQEYRANRNFMKVSKTCKALCVGWSSPMHQYTTGTDCLSSSLAEKDSKGLMLNVKTVDKMPKVHCHYKRGKAGTPLR